MTLQQINHRLELFKEYLAYRLENVTLIHPRQFKKVYPERFFHWEDILMTFDQWLYANRHEDLIVYNKPVIPIHFDVQYGGQFWRIVKNVGQYKLIPHSANINNGLPIELPLDTKFVKVFAQGVLYNLRKYLR